ncbi:MAG TPA: amino acid permease [Methylomirabilota bacterium]
MRRRLGLAGATALIVGQVIAVGIFLTPASMARLLGSPFWLLVVWLVAGAMAVAGALAYGELAARWPEAGGGYVYLREAWGPRLAFLYGWKCCLVMDPGITAALATGLAAYLAYLVPLSPTALKAAAIGAVALGAAVNMAGVRLGAGVVSGLAALKLGALATIVVGGFALGRGDWGHFVPFVAQRAGAEPLGAALAGAFVAAFFAFGGWWEAAKLAGEVRDPGRTMPRALVLGVAVVTAAYVLTSASFLYLVPLEAVTSDEAFAAQAGEALFGRAGGAVLAATVLISVAGSLFAIQMMLPRLYYAMSRDGLFPAALGRLHPTRETPVRAIALQAVLASVLVILGSFDAIVTYFIFVTVAFIGLTVLGLFRLRRREAEAARREEAAAAFVYRTPGFPLTPLVFLVLVGVLLVLLIAHRPVQALAGTVIVLAGLPVYGVLNRRARPVASRSMA